MKNIAAITLLAIAGMVTTGKALAQYHEARTEVRAKVPFDFTVGERLLPAGDYSIVSVSDAVIEIRNRDNNVAVLSTASNDDNKLIHGKLVFDEAADQYFLREILCTTMNVRLPASRWEKARIQEHESTVVVRFSSLRNS